MSSIQKEMSSIQKLYLVSEKSVKYLERNVKYSQKEMSSVQKECLVSRKKCLVYRSIQKYLEIISSIQKECQVSKKKQKQNIRYPVRMSSIYRVSQKKCDLRRLVQNCTFLHQAPQITLSRLTLQSAQYLERMSSVQKRMSSTLKCVTNF